MSRSSARALPIVDAHSDHSFFESYKLLSHDPANLAGAFADHLTSRLEDADRGTELGASLSQRERRILKQERDTWSLLASLYRDRLFDGHTVQQQNQQDAVRSRVTRSPATHTRTTTTTFTHTSTYASASSSSPNPQLSDWMQVQQLLKTDAKFREASIVIKWLQETYEVKAPLRAETLTTPNRAQPSGVSSATMWDATHVRPDYSQIFECVRAGKLRSAVQLLEVSSQPSLAALLPSFYPLASDINDMEPSPSSSLSPFATSVSSSSAEMESLRLNQGGTFFHDWGMVDSMGPRGGLDPQAGNMHWRLWRRTAHQIATSLSSSSASSAGTNSAAAPAAMTATTTTTTTATITTTTTTTSTITTTAPARDAYECALYGAAGGNLLALSPVCTSWHDALWAHLVVFVVQRLDKALSSAPLYWIDKTQQGFSGGVGDSEELGFGVDADSTVMHVDDDDNSNNNNREDGYHQSETTSFFSQLVGRLRASLPQQVSDQLFHNVQGDCIRGEEALVELVCQMRSLLDQRTSNSTSTTSSPQHPHQHKLSHNQQQQHKHLPHHNSDLGLFRFLAHLVLFLDCARIPIYQYEDSHGTAVEVLAEYVNQLTLTGQRGLVAFYTSLIPSQEAQAAVYARFLRSLNATPAERAQYLLLADQAGLDVSRIATLVVDLIIQDPTEAAASHAIEVGDNGLTATHRNMDAMDDDTPTSNAVSAVAHSRRQQMHTAAAALTADDEMERGNEEHDQQQDEEHGLASLDPLQMQSEPLTQSDRDKIEALQWLCFDTARSPGQQRVECLLYANSLARAFLLVRKLDAAQELLSLLQRLVPNLLRDISMSLGSAGDVNGGDDGEEEGMATDNEGITRSSFIKETNAIREHDCISIFVDMCAYFQQWWIHYQSKPKRSSSSSLVESPNRKTSKKELREATEHWQLDNAESASRVVAKIHQVIFYPLGWLHDRQQQQRQQQFAPHYTVDSEDDNEDDARRESQLHALRRLYIPHAIFLLHFVLHKSKRYNECVQVADYVMDSFHHLGSLFTQRELQRLVQLLRLSAEKALKSSSLSLAADARSQGHGQGTGQLLKGLTRHD